jgi:Uma2 family endonuclease
MILITAKWTLEDYHRMIAAGILDDRPVELLQGEIVEMPAEGEPHAYASDEAGEYLAKLLGDRAKVRHAKPITLPNDSEPEPDLAIVQRLGREYQQHHPYPENIFWVIEYASASLRKDLEVKTQIYAAAGIVEYWVVNLESRQLVVFRQIQDGHYASEQRFSSGTISPIAFPDLAIAIPSIINA